MSVVVCPNSLGLSNTGVDLKGRLMQEVRWSMQESPVPCKAQPRIISGALDSLQMVLDSPIMHDKNAKYIFAGPGQSLGLAGT